MKVKARKITNERAAELVLQLHKTGKFVPDCGQGHRPKKPICNLKYFTSLNDRHIIYDALKKCKTIRHPD